MASAMFHYDEAMTDLVVAACRERLSMDPVDLDFGGLVESLAWQGRPQDTYGMEKLVSEEAALAYAADFAKSEGGGMRPIAISPAGDSAQGA